MKFRLVSPGLYARVDENGATVGFYERPWVSGKRTTRALKASTLKAAQKELAAKRTDHERSALGLAASPYAPKTTVAALLDRFIADGAQGRKRKKPKTKKAVDCVNSAVIHLREFFGRLDAMQLNQKELLRYESFRRAEISKRYAGREMDLPRTGGRTVEIELTVLSNAMNHALRLGIIPFNPIAHREGIRLASEIRHSRDIAPSSAESIHQVASLLMEEKKTQPIAWMILFLSLTGCRKSEAAELRWDAANEDEPGYIDGDHLFIRRSKGGVNPFVVIGAELDEFLRALKNWSCHQIPCAGKSRYLGLVEGEASMQTRGSARSGNSIFFPCHPDSLGESINRACRILDVRRFTPHSLRAFYVTVRRSQGISDGQIAAEIGDRTGAPMIVQSYGGIPPNWRGRKEPLTLAPNSPAWAKWLPKEPSVLKMEKVA